MGAIILFRRPNRSVGMACPAFGNARSTNFPCSTSPAAHKTLSTSSLTIYAHTKASTTTRSKDIVTVSLYILEHTLTREHIEITMAPFSKPEAVLKQAEGLVSVGQMHAALQSLTEMFSSKRFRSTPLTSLEPIMLRFVELCVEMRKGRTAKEGLMQYKNIAQNTSVASIEVVINKFIQLADAKVQEAQEKADKAVAVDVDDLEASETPESILLGAVSGDQNKDRTDRALVTPWLKFLWESYRTALETLKNNARLEGVYQVCSINKLFETVIKCLAANRTTSLQVLLETRTESRVPSPLRNTPFAPRKCGEIRTPTPRYQPPGF